MSLDDAIRTLRGDPRFADLVRHAYLDRNVLEAAERFYRSAEFTDVVQLIGHRVPGSKVLDLGAGTGIASYAFAKAGAQIVYALEPDASEEVGRGAIDRLGTDLPIEQLSAVGESVPLPDRTLDIVYARQVLHHIRNLPQALKECARVLKDGGVFLACREHVVDNPQQLAEFLAHHPVHQLAGGENAYSLQEYLRAIQSAGLETAQILGPWDSVINAFPGVMSNAELRGFPRELLRRRLGWVGDLLGLIPGINAVVWKRIKRPTPGRLYSFLAAKSNNN